MPRTTVQRTVTLPVDLDGRLMQRAATEGRPVSNLVAALLREALRPRRRWPVTHDLVRCPACGEPASETSPPGCPAHLL